MQIHNRTRISNNQQRGKNTFSSSPHMSASSYTAKICTDRLNPMYTLRWKYKTMFSLHKTTLPSQYLLLFWLSLGQTGLSTQITKLQIPCLIFRHCFARKCLIDSFPFHAFLSPLEQLQCTVHSEFVNI